MLMIRLAAKIDTIVTNEIFALRGTFARDFFNLLTLSVFRFHREFIRIIRFAFPLFLSINLISLMYVYIVYRGVYF